MTHNILKSIFGIHTHDGDTLDLEDIGPYNVYCCAVKCKSANITAVHQDVAQFALSSRNLHQTLKIGSTRRLNLDPL